MIHDQFHIWNYFFLCFNFDFSSIFISHTGKTNSKTPSRNKETIDGNTKMNKVSIYLYSRESTSLLECIHYQHPIYLRSHTQKIVCLLSCMFCSGSFSLLPNVHIHLILQGYFDVWGIEGYCALLFLVVLKRLYKVLRIN